MSFPYKCALVTGATAGLGLALAEKMIEAGCFVIAVGRREDRLQNLVEKHGADKVAAEPFDMVKLDLMPAWSASIVKTYPKLDCIVLNAGIQRSLDFSKPGAISLPAVDQEITTNYTAPVHLVKHFTGHLQSQAPSPAAIVLVSSGLALVPLPRCPSYCATKAAIHSLAWSMRYQLEGDDASKHIKVMEIIPPAVRTELHSQQPDLVSKGAGQFGITIDEFLADAWPGLVEGKDEIPVSETTKARVNSEAEQQRRKAMEGMIAALKAQGVNI